MSKMEDETGSSELAAKAAGRKRVTSEIEFFYTITIYF